MENRRESLVGLRRPVTGLEAVGAVLLGCACVWMWATRGRPGEPASQPLTKVSAASDTYRPGVAVSLPGVTFDPAARTLVLALQSTCQYCTSSMPFYHSLDKIVRESGTNGRQRVRIVVMSPEPTPVVQAYLARYRVPSDATVQIPLRDFRVAGTPTALLVNGTGTVEKVWQGLQTEKGQAEIRRALTFSRGQ